MFDPQSNVPVIVSHDCVTCYGKEFSFTQHSVRQRNEAIKQAKAFGADLSMLACAGLTLIGTIIALPSAARKLSITRATIPE